MIRSELCPPVPVRFHPLAALLPWLAPAEMDALREDIGANGVREPIVFLGAELLDGRHRYQCARDLGLPYPRRDFGDLDSDGPDPLAFVISLNLARRHLSEAQRASVAAKLANMPQGFRSDLQPSANLPEVPAAVFSTRRAADLLKVSERSVTAVRAILRDGAPELVAALDADRVSVAAAADLATLPAGEQAGIVARGEREILAKAKEIRAERATERRAHQTRTLIAASAGNAALPEGRRFPVILADPPWRYDFGPTSRSVENHYPTMEIAEIMALDVGGLATDDAVLFLWATPTLLARAIDAMRGWGFTLTSNMIWDKGEIGTGYYFRYQHELLLFGTRGTPIVPPPEARPPSVLRAPRGAHSQKPDAVFPMIEAMYPDLPKIELFARSLRPGWGAWGNEAEPAA